MNAHEQKSHKRVTDDLAKQIEDLTEVVGERIAEVANDLRGSIGDERTHRLKLADEQRSYVDARDRELRDACQERWNETNLAQRRIIDRIIALQDRNLSGRLKWLILGR